MNRSTVAQSFVLTWAGKKRGCFGPMLGLLLAVTAPAFGQSKPEAATKPAAPAAKLATSASSPKEAKVSQLVDYVDPRIGVIDGNEGGFSHCVIGPQLPFGSINPSPQTIKGFHDGYAADQPIRGFGQLHVSGTGYGKYGQVFLSPQIGLAPGEEAHDSPKENELAKAYEYTVKLSRYNITTSVTPTRHAAIYRFVFPKSDDAHLLLDITHCLPIDIAKKVGGEVSAGKVTFTSSTKDEIRGYGTYRGGFGPGSYNVYFCARVSQKPVASGTWLNGEIHAGQAGDSLRKSNDRVGAYFKFSTAAQEAVYMKVAVSLKSMDQAAYWLNEEIPAWNYAAVKTQAQAVWNKHLAKLQATGGTEKDKRIFYTALYHTQVMPRDRTNDMPGFGKDVPVWDDHFAIWDTWRTMYPLQILINPDMVAGTINSFHARLKLNKMVKDAYIDGHDMIEEQGGNDVDNIIADAYVKKLPGVDWTNAYEVLKFHADEERLGSAGWRKNEPLLGNYKKQGWIPFGSMAGNMTLEYAYNDFCAAQVAQGLGHTDDYRRYLARSKKWVNLWNPDAESDGYKGFIMPKTQDKDFLPFDLKNYKVTWRHFFYEGSSWDYSWFVPHQIDTLIALNGGKEPFTKKLRYAFEQGYIRYNNEPAFLTVHLFHHVGRSDLSSYYVRKLLRESFTEKGYPGNDDSGAMSSWYLFAAMGIFPNAGQNLYYLTGPAFNEVKIQLTPSKTFRIVAKNASPDNIYIQSVKLDGKPYKNFSITHDDIMRGGVLEFEMGSAAAPPQ